MVVNKSSTARYSLARVRNAVMTGLGVGLAVTAIVACANFLPQRIWRADFSHFYLSASLLRNGTDVYAVPLRPYASSIRFPANDLMDWETNPPLLMWLLRPLAALPITTAFWAYVAVQALSVLIIFLITWYLIRGRLSAGAWMLGFGLSLFSYPMLYHLWLSQVQLPILALVMIGYAFWRRGWNGWATVVFALAGTAKLFPLVFVPLPTLAARSPARWRLLFLASVSVLALALIPGLPAWASFHEHTLPVLRAITERPRCNFTLPFLLGRLGRGIIPPTRLMAVEIVSAATLVGFSWWCCSRGLRSNNSAIQDAAFCLLLVTSLLASFIVWSHYLVFMIYPLLCVSSEIRVAPRRERAWLIALLVVCLLVFNMADAEPAPVALGRLSVLINNFPVFALGVLYWYFARLACSAIQNAASDPLLRH